MVLGDRMVMRLKPSTLHSAKLRKSARGEECTVNAPTCNGGGLDIDGNSKACLAHFPFLDPNTAGMGGKIHDIAAGYCCDPCHGYIDRRTRIGGQLISEADQLFYGARSMVRTVARMIETGVLKL